MMKIIALNEVTNNDNEDEYVNTLTKEAQEQVAFNQYNQALALLGKNQKTEALYVLKDLLSTQLLDEVQRPQVQDGRSRPMLSLKYSCLKNIASIKNELENYDDSIHHYLEAANLDDSDVMLWYKIGTIAIKIYNLELASLAFKHGLRENCCHWPSIDSIITVLYAIPDYMNCLLYISLALERDPTYIKGLAFRKQIFNDIPTLKECYQMYDSYTFDPPLDTKYDQNIGILLLNEAIELRKQWISTSATQTVKKPLHNLSIRRPLVHSSWLELGKSLIEMYKYIADNNLNFVSQIMITISEQSDLVLSNNVPRCSSTDFCKIKESSVHSDYSNINPEETILNNSLLKSDLNSSMELSSDIMEVDENYLDQNKLCANDIQIIEGNCTKIPINKIYVKDINNTECNIFEMKKETDLNFIKTYDKFNNENDKIINNKNENDSNNKFSIQTLKNETSSKFDIKEKGQKVKKRRRSSLCFLTQWAWSSSNTKRSSRARTSGRKDYEKDGIMLEETLKRIFPSKLLPDNTKFKIEESLKNNEYMDTMDLYDLDNEEKNTTYNIKNMEGSKTSNLSDNCHQKYFGTKQEYLDVNEFVKNHNGQTTIIIAIAKFIECLSTKWNYEWPNELPEMYIQLYLFMREHIPHTSPFVKSINFTAKLDANITLLFCELYTDKWLSTNPCILPSSSSDKLGIGISANELGYLIFITAQDDLYNEENLTFIIRLLWLKANIFFYQGDMEISLKTLELLLHHMQQFQFGTCKPSFKLRNCKYNSIICVKTVKEMLTSILRGKKYSEIKYLYQEKKYEELSYILKETFDFSKQRNQFMLCKDEPIDRSEHLQLLLDSLWQLQQYEDCFLWAETCLNESWHNYMHTTSTCTRESNRSKWIKSILHSLEKLYNCVVEISTFIVKYLPDSRQSRLVQNLIYIICHQLDLIDNTLSMSIESVYPWILLHFILQYEEDKQRAKSGSIIKYKSHSSIHSDSDSDEEDIPSSITILLKGHDFLGRHGWCCIDDGRLLIFIINLIIPKLHYPSYLSIKGKLRKPLEQIFYCLYGHQVKFSSSIRSGTKYLDEHVKSHINLNWEACQLLFEFYKPKTLPSFESKRIESINTDTAILFKKLCTLIPHDSNPTFIKEEMDAYLLGKIDNIPCVKKTLRNSISYIYYLIADHYFKAASNQSWINAMNYYILDLCLHPNELNSWAGLAMSTSTLMETWLNNFEPNINEEKYLTKAKMAQRSYEHAIDLAPLHLTIWTEFGSFLYTVHSFCSRLLKQESDSLNMERFRILETQKDEMLHKAKNCFISANNIYTASQGIDEPQDERWLYQYMLGKIAEKKNEDPPIFLKHYSKANQLLFENNAQYPKRVSHKNPQNLAVEALEVYYRIYASILKYLEQNEGKPLKRSLFLMLEQILKNCMQSPFMTYNSIFIDALKKPHTIYQETELLHKIPCNVSENKIFTNNDTHIARQCDPVVDTTKTDSRKRHCDGTLITNEAKKIKSSNVSHLQLMQDVLALIDDLITRVCDKVTSVPTVYKQHNYESKISINYENRNTSCKLMDKKCYNKDLTDNQLMKKYSASAENSEFINNTEDTIKAEGSWKQNEDIQIGNVNKTEKNEDVSKNSKIRLLTRRGSQESTTTTQTSTSETNNSTCSSSDDTSSSNDSSDSSCSSDSDSESAESDTEKRKEPTTNEDVHVSEEEASKLTEYCLAGLEQCVLRFPEHYKSIYRLAYFFFYNKKARNVLKCKELLLGTYICQFHQNQIIQGLFAERKTTNFFNGIWRIPTHEIDRPGSFASHMSRCILLLMQVLKETEDSRMLTEICLQLRKIPDTDKKYLRDSEREQLSCQAITLCIQCLRNKIKNWSNQAAAKMYNSFDKKSQVLLDILFTYKSLKTTQKCEISELSKVQKLLEDAYVACIGNTNIQGNIFEQAKEFCKKLRLHKNSSITTNTDINAHVIEPSSVESDMNVIPPSTLNTSTAFQSRKPPKTVISGRPRGRPPGLNKFSHNDATFNQSRYKAKQIYGGNTPDFSNPLNSPYCSTSLLDSNMLAMLSAGFNANMIDSAMSYFNKIDGYQDIFSQSQNNLNTISNPNINYNNKNYCNAVSVRPATNSTFLEKSLNMAKEKSDISIIPVSENVCQSKLNQSKSAKFTTTSSVNNEHITMTAQLPNSVQITPTSHFSLLKQSQAQQRILQTLSSQLSLPINSTTSGDIVSLNHPVFPQTNKTVMATDNIINYTSRSGTSLQHKLLSKKQNQSSYPPVASVNLAKKQRQHKTDVSSSYLNVTNSVVASCMSLDNNAISISHIPSSSSKHPKLSGGSEKHVKPKTSSAQIPIRSLQNTNNKETLSVLSQLKQHSHLEIIPQMGHIKEGVNLVKSSGRSVSSQSLYETVKISSANSISVYELPRSKTDTTFPNKKKLQKKIDKDDVEIITLDD